MKSSSKTFLAAGILLAIAALALVCLSTPVMAGHGGGGGGFHGGGGGSFHGGGYGGGGYHGGGYSGYHGGETNWSAANHTPSFSTPHTNFNPSRSNMASGAWSHNEGRNALAEHSGMNDRYPGHGSHPDWYHGNWNNHADHHWNHWNNWNRWPAAWWGAGFAAGADLADWSAPWAWGYWSYSNPYWTAPVTVDNTVFDYSQPIMMASTTNDPTTQPPQLGQQWPVSQTTSADEANQLLDAARDAFANGDYNNALTQCDKAIAKQPNNPLFHEFRGLTLFALHRYADAAGPLYAVLSVGPGWDWTTLSSLYPDVDVYTNQLRALEQYVVANPRSADARFVLAYEYMTCGHADAAAAQFKAATELNPKDQLSAQLFSALTTNNNNSNNNQPAVTTPAMPVKPVDASTLVGNWKANRTDGTNITLNLNNGKYDWKFNQKDKPQEFNGAYTLTDNLLVLKQGNTPVMVGQVTPVTNNRFTFKLPGNNPNDPGLTFSK